MKKILISIFVLFLLAGLSVGWGQASTAKAASYNSKTYAKEVVRLVNVERAKRGLKKVKMKTTVSSAAQIRAKEILKLFSHTRPSRKAWYTVLGQKKIKYSTAGENIAFGQKSPKAVMKAWMKSPGHRKNILTKAFKYIGVGVYRKNGRIYWVQEFIG